MAKSEFTALSRFSQTLRAFYKSLSQKSGNHPRLLLISTMPKVLSSPSSISSWPSSLSLAPVYPWYCQQSDPDKRQLTTLFRPFDGSATAQDGS